MSGELTPAMPCGCPVPRSDPLARAKAYLELAGRDFHRDASHPGPYRECPRQSCYQTNRLVSA